MARGVRRHALTLAVAGAVLLACAGWLGGKLVYEEHVGVDEEGPPRSLLEPGDYAQSLRERS